MSKIEKQPVNFWKNCLNLLKTLKIIKGLLVFSKSLSELIQNELKIYSIVLGWIFL